MKIEMRAHVITRDGHEVGEVHRVVVDIENQAVVAIVVLKGRLLSRDILVPIDFVDRTDYDGATVRLRLDKDELDQLPDFAFNEILAPPPTWAFPIPSPGGAFYVPVHQRERLGPTQEDILPGTKVWATDGEIGRVEDIELDSQTGRLLAFWIRGGSVFAHDIRVPVEWVERADDLGIYLAGSRHEIESVLGEQSRALRPTITRSERIR